MQDVFVGVDGGGTKTKVIVLNKSRDILKEQLFGSFNINQIYEKGFCKLVEEIALSLKEYKIVGIVFGIPGYNEAAKNDEVIERVISSKFHNYLIYNDVEIAYFGGHKERSGIHVVAGTGSMAITFEGVEKQRSGGFGPIIGDEGSAYWIGSKALNYVSKTIDGRELPSLLSEYICTEYGIVDLASIIKFVYCSNNSRQEIAKLSKLVDLGAEHGCSVCMSILDDAAEELSKIILVLKKEDNQLVTYSGGVFNSKYLTLKVTKLMNQHKLCFNKTNYDPGYGAALFAIKEWNSMQ